MGVDPVRNEDVTHVKLLRSHSFRKGTFRPDPSTRTIFSYTSSPGNESSESPRQNRLTFTGRTPRSGVHTRSTIRVLYVGKGRSRSPRALQRRNGDRAPDVQRSYEIRTGGEAGVSLDRNDLRP